MNTISKINTTSLFFPLIQNPSVFIVSHFGGKSFLHTSLKHWSEFCLTTLANWRFLVGEVCVSSVHPNPEMIKVFSSNFFISSIAFTLLVGRQIGLTYSLNSNSFGSLTKAISKSKKDRHRSSPATRIIENISRNIKSYF